MRYIGKFLPNILWYGFWQVILIVKIGTYTGGPSLITFWDALWMPFVITWLPVLFFIGWNKAIDD